MGKAVVKILVVTDDIGSFVADKRFGLTELVKTLREGTAFAVFEVTTAHRNPNPIAIGWDPGGDLQAFTFTDAALAPFDEVWLFGVATPSDLKRISAQEVAALHAFMDRGGGVFATGDHENLGASLCDQLHRVRSMRRWKWPDRPAANIYDDFPEESDLAPPVFGSHRHDTTQPGHDNIVQFDDQSDDVPQTIRLKMYQWSALKLSRLYIMVEEVRRYPHPLLCTAQGPITVLPDHMHEGECEEPETLDPVEYPAAASGTPQPQVIAWGKVRGGVITPVLRKDIGDADFSTIVNPFGLSDSGEGKAGVAPTAAEEFGAIGAYDGHHAGVGRVVVDSTFHHFIDINLIAAHVMTSDPSKKKGFLSSPQGQAAYSRIKAYFKNIAVWLAPAAKQDAMFLATLDATTKAGAFDEVRNVSRFTSIAMGEYGRDALGRIASPCTTISWIGKVINFQVFEPRSPKSDLDLPVFRVRGLPDAMLTAAAGGIMREALRTAESQGEGAILKRGHDLLLRGAGAGLEELHVRLREHTRLVEAGAGALGALGARLKSSGAGKALV